MQAAKCHFPNILSLNTDHPISASTHYNNYKGTFLFWHEIISEGIKVCFKHSKDKTSLLPGPTGLTGPGFLLKCLPVML